MATDKDDIISDGKLFHKNTIMLKYEFRKREVLHMQVCTKIARTGKSGMVKKLGNILIDVKFVHPGFTFVEEYDAFNFVPVWILLDNRSKE